MRISLEILRWSWRRVSWWEFLCKFSGWSWRRACWSERSEPFCQVIGKGSRHANWPGAETCLALAWQQIEVWHLLSGERQLERPPVELEPWSGLCSEWFSECYITDECSEWMPGGMTLLWSLGANPPPRCRFFLLFFVCFGCFSFLVILACFSFLVILCLLFFSSYSCLLFHCYVNLPLWCQDEESLTWEAAGYWF